MLFCRDCNNSYSWKIQNSLIANAKLKKLEFLLCKENSLEIFLSQHSPFFFFEENFINNPFRIKIFSRMSCSELSCHRKGWENIKTYTASPEKIFFDGRNFFGKIEKNKEIRFPIRRLFSSHVVSFSCRYIESKKLKLDIRVNF